MGKIILITTSSHAYAVGNEELVRLCKENGFRPAFCEDIKPPFPFAAEEVFSIVAGAQKRCGEGTMAYFPNLKMVTPFGVGIDHIDLVAAKKRGIIVTNAPAVSCSSVAELTMAFILVLARGVIVFNQSMKNGKWERRYGVNLSGKNLGIVGLGNIGKEVARLAFAFGMRVWAHDVFYDEKFLSSYPVQKTDFETLLKESDFITIHVPSTAETKNMLDEKAFSLMKKGVSLVNTSRGDIIDVKSLLVALESGRVAGVALDVFSKEPPGGDPELERLVKHPKVIATPHIAAFCPEAHSAIAARILKNILAVAENRMQEVDYA